MPHFHRSALGSRLAARLLASFAFLGCPSTSIAASHGPAGALSIMSMSMVSSDASGHPVLIATQRPLPGSTVLLMLSAHAARATRPAVFVMPVPPSIRFTGRVKAPKSAAVSYSADGLGYSVTPMKLVSGAQQRVPSSAYTSVRFELPELAADTVVNFSVEGVAR